MKANLLGIPPKYSEPTAARAVQIPVDGAERIADYFKMSGRNQSYTRRLNRRGTTVSGKSQVYSGRRHYTRVDKKGQGAKIVIVTSMLVAALASLTLFLVNGGFNESSKAVNSEAASLSVGIPASDESDAEFYAEKQEANIAITRLERDYEEAREYYLVTERMYLERLATWGNTVLRYEIQKMPGNFAGELPAHDLQAFREVKSHAKELESNLESYFKYYLQPDDQDKLELETLYAEAQAIISLPLPTTGSRLEDAKLAMQTEEFKEVHGEVIGLSVDLAKEKWNAMSIEFDKLYKTLGEKASEFLK